LEFWTGKLKEMYQENKEEPVQEQNDLINVNDVSKPPQSKKQL